MSHGRFQIISPSSLGVITTADTVPRLLTAGLQLKSFGCMSRSTLSSLFNILFVMFPPRVVSSSSYVNHLEKWHKVSSQWILSSSSSSCFPACTRTSKYCCKKSHNCFIGFSLNSWFHPWNALNPAQPSILFFIKLTFPFRETTLHFLLFFLSHTSSL